MSFLFLSLFSEFVKAFRVFISFPSFCWIRTGNRDPRFPFFSNYACSRCRSRGHGVRGRMTEANLQGWNNRSFHRVSTLGRCDPQISQKLYRTSGKKAIRKYPITYITYITYIKYPNIKRYKCEIWKTKKFYVTWTKPYKDEIENRERRYVTHTKMYKGEMGKAICHNVGCLFSLSRYIPLLVLVASWSYDPYPHSPPHSDHQ